MEGFSPPCEFNFNKTNLSEEWKNWSQKLKLYLTAADLESKSDERKIAILLHCIGAEGVKIYNTFKWETKEIKYSDVLKAFDNQFSPKKNLVYERYKFLSCRQKHGQTVEQFLTELKDLASSCEYKSVETEMIRDVFVMGIQDETLKEKLIRAENLTLEKTIEIYKAYETSKVQLKHMITDTSNIASDLNKLNLHKTWKRPQHNNHDAAKHHYKRNTAKSGPSKSKATALRSTVAADNKNAGRTITVCHRCGQVHRTRCPADGVKCLKCSKIGHFFKFCNNRPANKVNLFKSNDPKYYNDNDTESTNSSFFLGSLNLIKKNTTNGPEEVSSWTILITINGKQTMCQLDTGAQINVMSLQSFKKLNLPLNIIKTTSKKVTTYTGETIKVMGKCCLRCLVNKTEYKINFIIVEASPKTDNAIILGLKECIRLNLIQRVMKLEKLNTNYENILENNKDLFEGLGCLDIECRLILKENAVPIVDSPRKTPFKLNEKLKQELNRMEKLGVIAKVHGPTQWVSSIVVVEKPNKSLRVCLDPRNLNNNLMRSHFPLPEIESIKSSLNGATMFSTLDASSGFWMIKLDKQSTELCTFNTPFGRYKFLRLPYGLNVAPEIFHKTMVDLFSDLSGVIIYVDDILIWGKTQEEHDIRLRSVLERARKVGLKFNKQKCRFGLNSVKYFGHIFSANGVRPDSDKIKAIVDMPSPKCVKDLQRFLGLINYIGSYVKDLSSKTIPLRELLKKKSKWEWNESHELCYNKLKTLVSNPPVLAYYDPNLKITLSVDASQFAVGAVILQNGRALAYASKTLTDCQRNYAQIEKELYAIVFGCKKFHQYIYGNKVDVETDHKPLVTLSKKAMADIPTRLQRMMLSLQIYDLNICYKPGTELAVADTLSRAPLPEKEEDLDNDIRIHVNILKASLAVSEKRLEQIKEELKTDKQMQTLKNQIIQGWPDCPKKVPTEIREFWKLKSQLFVIEDLIFKNNNLVIPKRLRKEMINILHEGHTGIVRCKRRARSLIYWPKMSEEIENFVRNCYICQENSKSNIKEELIPHAIPTYAWENLATDLFEFDRKHYLLIVDYFSKYIEVVHVSSYDSNTVVEHMKNIFSRHGIPRKLVSDNGPPFSSSQFKSFMNDWDIEHVTSSPNYPKSNGLAERSTQTIKDIMRKTKKGGQDFHLAMLEYRTTPLESGYSPSELLMCRKLRTKIPVASKLLTHRLPDFKGYNRALRNKAAKVKKYYDLNSRVLSELYEGDVVLFKKEPQSSWIEGIIISRCKQPRSYIVKSKNGKCYRRNRIHLKLLHNNTYEEPSFNDNTPNENSHNSPNEYTVTKSTSEEDLAEIEHNEANDFETAESSSASEQNENQETPKRSVQNETNNMQTNDETSPGSSNKKAKQTSPGSSNKSSNKKAKQGSSNKKNYKTKAGRVVTQTKRFPM